MYFIYLVLQVIQKTADVHAIHLGVVKLKGDGQSGLEQTFPILSPCKKRIVPTAGILVDYHIQLSVWQCRCADNHGILQRCALTGLGGLAGHLQVVGIELPDIFGIRDIAQGDSSFVIQHNHIDSQPFIAVQMFWLGQQIELFNAAGSLTDAPAQ